MEIIKPVKNFIAAIFRETWDEIAQLFVIREVLGGDDMADQTQGGKPAERIGFFEKIFHQFSHEDEIQWNRLFSEVGRGNSDAEKLFMEFVAEAVKEGFDKDTLRLRLIGCFLADKKEQCQTNSAVDTVVRIISEGEYENMRKIAIDRELLMKKPVKRFLQMMWRNKISSILWILASLMIIAYLLLQFLKYIFE